MTKRKIILKGIPASAGVAKGRVKIILDPSDCSKMKKGDILVANITDPSFVVVMSKAAAIITDIGGLASHPAIIARELGVPCVVSTLKATKVLKNNDKIKVDGTRGIIYKM